MSFKQQKQLFTHDPENGQHGDCWRTCVACLLDIPCEAVPHVHKDMSPEQWREWTILALDEFSHVAITMAITPGEDGSPSTMEEAAKFAWKYCAPIPFILSGLSPRSVNHAVVVYTPDFIHDPSQQGGGLIGPCEPTGYWMAEYIVRKPRVL